MEEKLAGLEHACIPTQMLVDTALRDRHEKQLILGWLRRVPWLVAAQGALPLGITGTSRTRSLKLMHSHPFVFTLQIKQSYGNVL